MVVSGSHLIFLEVLLFFLPRPLQMGVLGAYCYLTGFQPPVTRAFLRRVVAAKASQRLGLTSLQVEALSVVVSLLLIPEWLFSRSFLMSWMCGLALSSPSVLPKSPALDMALKSYLFMLPFCWTAPVTVFWNTLLAPVVGIVLFPACLLAIAIPPLHILADGMWQAFLSILRHGPQSPPSLVFFASTSLWPIPVILHLLLISAEVSWRRESAFSLA
jgi:hypothetical protein